VKGKVLFGVPEECDETLEGGLCPGPLSLYLLDLQVGDQRQGFSRAFRSEGVPQGNRQGHRIVLQAEEMTVVRPPELQEESLEVAVREGSLDGSFGMQPLERRCHLYRKCPRRDDLLEPILPTVEEHLPLIEAHALFDQLVHRLVVFLSRIRKEEDITILQLIEAVEGGETTETKGGIRDPKGSGPCEVHEGTPHPEEHPTHGPTAPCLQGVTRADGKREERDAHH
jgi:hypothetical protein